MSAHIQTLFKTYTPAQAIAKAKERTIQYGVKFDWYSTGKGLVVLPVRSKDTLQNEVAGLALIPHLDPRPLYSTTFAKLAELSGLPLKDVIEGAEWLVKNRPYEFRYEVCRTGNAAALRKVQKLH